MDITQLTLTVDTFFPNYLFSHHSVTNSRKRHKSKQKNTIALLLFPEILTFNTLEYFTLIVNLSFFAYVNSYVFYNFLSWIIFPQFY